MTVNIGLGAAVFVDPPSGSVVANFEGTLNATTLTCNITNAGFQISTQWSIENFGGNPALQTVINAPDFFDIDGDLVPSTTLSYHNRLTVLNFTSVLDNATLYCGSGAFLRQANFIFKIYSKSSFIIRFSHKTGSSDCLSDIYVL